MPKRFIYFGLYLLLRGILAFKTMKIKNYFQYILFAASASFLFACTERININTDDSPPRLVIYGYITTDTTQQAIRITRSTGYFDTITSPGISNAIVSISCEDAVYELKESSDEAGLYLTSPDVYGIPGKTYTLHASVDFDGDGNTEEYEATSYLPFPVTLDSAAITQSNILKDHLQVLVWGELPEESSNNFSLHCFRNGVIMNDSLIGFRSFQSDYIVNNKIEAMPIWLLDSEDDKEKLSPGDTITVQIESITPEYATFMDNARTELRGPIPLFGGPPANVETNIHCLNANSKTGISGFFTAYSKCRTSTIYVTSLSDKSIQKSTGQ